MPNGIEKAAKKIYDAMLEHNDDTFPLPPSGIATIISRHCQPKMVWVDGPPKPAKWAPSRFPQRRSKQMPPIIENERVRKNGPDWLFQTSRDGWHKITFLLEPLERDDFASNQYRAWMKAEKAAVELADDPAADEAIYNAESWLHFTWKDETKNEDA